jgi:hypothetical protein
MKAMRFVGVASVGVMATTTIEELVTSTIGSGNTFLLQIGGVGDEWCHFHWDTSAPTMLRFKTPFDGTPETGKHPCLRPGSSVVLKRPTTAHNLYVQTTAGSMPVTLSLMDFSEAK